jgi:hypothetical protein
VCGQRYAKNSTVLEVQWYFILKLGGSSYFYSEDVGYVDMTARVLIGDVMLTLAPVPEGGHAITFTLSVAEKARIAAARG